MHKFYRYNSYNDNDYKLTVGKNNLSYFKSIVYDGFKFLTLDTDIYGIDFEIEPQVLRKIKLKQIDNKLNNVERKIIQLLERSTIKESTFDNNFANSYSNKWYVTNSSYTDYEYYDEYLELDKKTHKDKNIFQQKVNNYKAKQYESKARFR